MGDDNVYEFPRKKVDDVKIVDDLLESLKGKMKNVVILGECTCHGNLMIKGTLDPINTIHYANQLICFSNSHIEMLQRISELVISEHGKKISVEELERLTKEYLFRLPPPEDAG